MPSVASIPAQCDNCGHNWELALQCSIELSNGNTISFAPGSVRGTCPQCGTQGVNLATTSATSTGKGIRGLFTVLGTVSANAEDLEQLTAIAFAAKESGAGNAEVAEQIRTSIPRLRPLADWLLSPQGKGVGVATWMMLIVTVWMLILTLKSTSSAPATPPTPAPDAPISQPTIIINCPYSQEQEINELVEQLAREIQLNIKDSEIIDQSPPEPKPRHWTDKNPRGSDR